MPTEDFTQFRRDHIVKACQKLYAEQGIDAINIGRVGELTNIGRTAIYNYFKTKEEIVLAMATKDYAELNDDLERILEGDEVLSKEKFAAKLAKTLCAHRILLEVVSTNLRYIENSSRPELLKDFKVQYGRSCGLLDELTGKFLGYDAASKERFRELFFTFWHGIIPICEPTAKQLQAIKDAGLTRKKQDTQEFVCKVLCAIIGCE